MRRFTRFFRFFGWGSVAALLLLGVVEAWLHSDGFLYRYRSVFAAGRAMDKLRYVEAHSPTLLEIGNSRIDNDFDPRTVLIGSTADITGFNLGMPGANAGILYGIVGRLEQEGKFGKGGTRAVILGLDESLLQAEDSLGYGVFFADTAWLWRDGDWRGLLSYGIRLWGFSANLKGLREPAKALEFIRASLDSVDPIGGGAAQFLGYRAGFGGEQDAGQVSRQEETYDSVPDPAQVDILFAMLELLQRHDVRVAVVYPPLLNREVLYLSPENAISHPYLAVAERLSRMKIPCIALEPGAMHGPAMFINAGHLNDTGAQYYSRLLNRRLHEIWPDLFRVNGR